jgi:hypothetical protein
MSATREQSRAAAVKRRLDKLDYVRQMLRELRDMVEGENEKFLIYLIAMAYFAASDRIREQHDGNIASIDSLKPASQRTA